MLHIITPDHHASCTAIMDDMFRKRYDVVVREWGWDIPGVSQGYDKDQFDTDNTVYVVVTDGEKGVVASTRLNPTTGPHMMSELFSEYCNLQPFPVADDTWECSRYVVNRSFYDDPVLELQIRAQLGLGIVQHCISEGITSLSWLTHQRFYNLIQKVWKTEPMGLPRRDTADGWAWIPAVSKIEASALQRHRDRIENAEKYVQQNAKSASNEKAVKAA